MSSTDSKDETNGQVDLGYCKGNRAEKSAMVQTKFEQKQAAVNG